MRPRPKHKAGSFQCTTRALGARRKQSTTDSNNSKHNRTQPACGWGGADSARPVAHHDQAPTPRATHTQHHMATHARSSAPAPVQACPHTRTHAHAGAYGRVPASRLPGSGGAARARRGGGSGRWGKARRRVRWLREGERGPHRAHEPQYGQLLVQIKAGLKVPAPQGGARSPGAGGQRA
jgi:hypothetical protein